MWGRRSFFVCACVCLLVSILGWVGTAGAATLSHDLRQNLNPTPRLAVDTCGSTSVTESSTNTIVPNNSIACATGLVTKDNSYWRAFQLSDFGVINDFEVCQVEIGIQSAVSGNGSGQPMTVNLYTSSQPFPTGYPASLTLIGTASIVVADQALSLLDIPVSGTAPAGSQLVVEIHVPDGTGAGHEFFIGSNTDPETAPSYISAVDCAFLVPTPTDGLTPDLVMHIVMTVSGSDAIAPVALNVDSAGNGVLEIGEATTIEPSWINNSPTSFSLTGFGTSLTPPPVFTDSNADYGTLAPGDTSNCLSATGDCYGIQVDGPRPQQHFDLQMQELVTPVGLGSLNPVSKTWILHVGGSFSDVDTDLAADPYYPSIETVFHHSVTAGCQDGTVFCPTDSTTRQEMAVFLLKALLGSDYDPPDCTGIFTDVICTPGTGFPDWIEDLFNRGITAGCQAEGDPLMYCPTRDVLRQEMAVFLLKTSQGSDYDPPDCTGLFTDVTCTPGVGFSDWIEDIYNRGITAGCSPEGDPLAFCPTGDVLRQQMAVFLTKTFSLVLYGL